eukprot:CAMPEP_0117021842 /NCGR_PEP_ID=MMETSP0472-20121206/16454_1 /TAXON_ID=693140 ORGANISM="Tiarina fusus, Strain LIS" /NCGR_SAMPLE_ID=MMETSP0472 /ASSEMBLY_ACC=CAM_ASM_000603 /LENGTH=178 /DNA_ID=CAMNT_0004727479 /DNA_START=491 /DNA_END=1024 /DNA_ORIENTATION=-
MGDAKKILEKCQSAKQGNFMTNLFAGKPVEENDLRSKLSESGLPSARNSLYGLDGNSFEGPACAVMTFDVNSQMLQMLSSVPGLNCTETNSHSVLDAAVATCAPKFVSIGVECEPPQEHCLSEVIQRADKIWPGKHFDVVVSFGVSISSLMNEIVNEISKVNQNHPCGHYRLEDPTVD